MVSMAMLDEYGELIRLFVVCSNLMRPLLAWFPVLASLFDDVGSWH